tara:strand:+ start:479 stop:1051 length:573 start_codon:yes stop_codon:yes gene_type:complete
MGTLKTTNIQSISGSGTVTLGVSGETIDIPSGVTLDSTGATITGALTMTPAFNVFLSADQTLTNSTPTKIQFNTEAYDTNSAYDASTNYRFTVPSGQDGKYFFYSNVMFQGLAASRIARLDFYKNGSQAAEFRDVTAAANDISISGQIGVSLSAGDYIEVFAYQNDSGTENAAGGAYDITNFGGYKIIGA